MKVSEIYFSQMDPRFFNAEYYKPEYIEAESLLSRIEKVKDLEEISESINSGSYVREYVFAGTLYLRVNNIKESEIDLSDIKFVDVVRSQIPKKIRVKANDILLTRTGTIGIAHVVPEEIAGAVISQHLTKITVKDEINPFYLAAFLNSRFGRLQSERGASGSMQKELIHNIQRYIKTPIPPRSFQDKIEGHLIRSRKKVYQARKLKKKFESILYQLLDLNQPVILDSKSFSTTSLKIAKASRFDAEYFQPKFEKLIKEIQKHPNIKSIDEIAESIRHPREFKREFIKDGKIEEGRVGYIRVQNVVKGYIDDTDIASIPKKLVLEYGLSRLHEGEILVTRSGTLGVAACVTKRFEGYIASADFLKIRLKKVVDGIQVHPIYIAAFLNSSLGSTQLEQTSIGALQRHTTTNSLAHLMIPIPSKEIQSKIKNLSLKPYQLGKEGRKEIDKAKQEVEKFVVKLAKRQND